MAENNPDRAKGLMIVVSAPSGTGKTTICRNVLNLLPGLSFSVSHTTRKARRGEQDGRDYHFIEEDEFRRLADAGEFAEWAENYGHLYGTSRRVIDDMREQGHDILLDVDPQGAKNLKTIFPDGVFVFILPPTIGILRERLARRGSEDAGMLRRRLNRAVEEITEARWYDYVIINDTIKESTGALKAICTAEKHRYRFSQNKIDDLVRKRETEMEKAKKVAKGQSDRVTE
ncbi:MAG: guanylate kinase [Deltaproteobacteria bacterium]|nr:guanylate kinase [Deltaproteobacteria bacterium]